MLLLSVQLLFAPGTVQDETLTRLSWSSFWHVCPSLCSFLFLLHSSFTYTVHICHVLTLYPCLSSVLVVTKATGGHTMIGSYFQSEPQQRCNSWRGCSTVAFFRAPELPFFRIPEKCFWSVFFRISSQSMLHASILKPHLISFLLASLLSTSGRRF